MSERRIAVRFHGRVQGVGFRWFARGLAERSGVTGWIRNEPDGTVSAEAQGPADRVEAWLAGVRGGPPGARVEAVDVEERPVRAAAGRGFEIARRSG